MKNKIPGAMGIIMLVCFITLGFFAFPVGIPLCGAIGLAYGIKSKDKSFTRGSLIALLIGFALIIYTLFLIHSM